MNVKSKERKKNSSPKVRRTWKINPSTRVTPSGKIYQRSTEKKEIVSLDAIDRSGERE